MRPVKIITDSCSDMSRDIRVANKIDYVRMKTIYNGEETWASLDFEYYTPKSLYDIMRNGERVLTTPVPPDEFERVFTKYLVEGYDIVYIGCSLKQSTSVNDGKKVAAKLLNEYTNAEIYCIDSMNASMGEGLVALLAAKYRDQGMSANEIAHKVSDEVKKVNQYCTVHTLDCLKRAGRIKASAAFFGNLFNIKPIIISDINGDQVGMKKVKGREESVKEMVAMLKETIIGSENQYIYITHADCADEAAKLAQYIMDEIPCKNVHLSYIGPIIGASIGPGALAIFGYGKEVTFEG
ncbi:MAG: DegV family protein [Treponema sp.]|nr:DegV family protein [Treponema sp.]